MKTKETLTPLENYCQDSQAALWSLTILPMGWISFATSWDVGVFKWIYKKEIMCWRVKYHGHDWNWPLQTVHLSWHHRLWCRPIPHANRNLWSGFGMVCSRRQLNLANPIYTQKKTYLFYSIGNHRTRDRVDHYAHDTFSHLVPHGRHI